MYLETKRLIIRIFNINDIRDAFEYLSDKIVMEYIEPVMSYNKVEYFIKEHGIKNKNIYAIVIKDVNKVIGHLIFKEYNNKNEYEIGWIINKDYWNKGYATEASKCIINYGFEVLKLFKIVGETEKENIQSIKLLEKLGMQYSGKNKDGLIEYGIENSKILIFTPPNTQ